MNEISMLTGATCSSVRRQPDGPRRRLAVNSSRLRRPDRRRSASHTGNNNIL